MRVLVTGGTGFIGAHVCRGLLEHGEEVVAYENRPIPERVSDIAESLRVVEGDVTDLALLVRTMKRERISHVVHLAAFLPERALRENPSKALLINGQGTNNVFDASLAGDVERVVYASSDGVCALGPEEDAPVRPRSVYGAVKYLNEIMGRVFSDEFDLSIIGLRFVVNYGPGGRLLGDEIGRGYPSGRTFGVLEAVMRGETVSSPDTGEEGARWMYVKDTARLLRYALTAKTERRIVNLAGWPTSLGAAVSIVQSEFDDAGSVHFASTTGEPPLADHLFEVDPSEAQAALGFEAAWSLVDGLREYATWVRYASTAKLSSA